MNRGHLFFVNVVMRLIFPGMVPVLLLILSQIPAVGQNVKITEDKKWPVSGFSTFSMGKGDVVVVMQRSVPDSVLLTKLSRRIVEEMSSRGYRESADSGALRVSFVAEVLEKQQDNVVGPLGQQPADNAGQVDQAKTWTQVTNQSSLSIVITNSKTGKRIWHSETTSETTSADIGEVLLNAAARSLRKVPRRK